MELGLPILHSFFCLSFHLFFCPSFCHFVLLSFHLTARGFSWNCIWLSFSKFCHGAINPHEDVCDRAPKIGKNRKKRVFWIYWKIWSLDFTEFILQYKYILFALFLYKSHIRENFCSWDMDQNIFNQSDCRIFLSTISPEQINEKARFFAYWYNLI